ncbi:MAG: hypothetical protein ACKO6E_10520 [Planctomycetota bacterium]
MNKACRRDPDAAEPPRCGVGSVQAASDRRAADDRLCAARVPRLVARRWQELDG